MKILMAHNFYRHLGGEDQVFENEVALLRSHGHTVIPWTESNEDLATNPIRAGAEAIWSNQAFEKAQSLLKRHQPDIVHFHNIFFKITPAAYYAAADADVPVIQTVHNYRLICPKATLFRDGQICEDCVNKIIKWPAVLHECYRDSRVQSAGVSTILAFHRMKGTWSSKIDLFIALTSFMKEKLVQGGIEADRVEVKPNFVMEHPDPRADIGDYFLFAGRLEVEKGIMTLLSAWEELTDAPLLIAGKGSLEGEVEEWIDEHPDRPVQFLGWIDREELGEKLRRCRALIFPSLCYEGFPMVISEAIACGVPVIASRLGALDEIITDGMNGLLYSPGDALDLASKVQHLQKETALSRVLGRAARTTYERSYRPVQNYEQLVSIYDRARSLH